MAELLSACSQDEEEESALISNQGELGSLTGKEQTVSKSSTFIFIYYIYMLYAIVVVLCTSENTK